MKVIKRLQWITVREHWPEDVELGIENQCYCGKVALLNPVTCKCVTDEGKIEKWGEAGVCSMECAAAWNEELNALSEKNRSTAIAWKGRSA